jgi:hypothetical protein
MSIQHWMTFGTFAEQQFFTYPDKNTYNGVVLNANMVAHAPAGLAAFLLEKTNPKTVYMIDPLTHAFQHDPDHIQTKDGNVKSSVLNLAKSYGEIITDLVGKRSLVPGDFDIAHNRKDFVEKCLEFQRTSLAKVMADHDTNKKYLGQTEEQLRPYALISPYFYMKEATVKRWLPLMSDCVDEAVILVKEGEKLFAAIVINEGVVLDDDLITEIANTFSSKKLDGFLIWIDEMDEHDASGRVLKGYLKLAKALRGDEGREIINLHGGYFSILAASGKFGYQYLTGVAHGPEFGEVRGVVPVGGGIPIAKYYIKKLHNRIRYSDTIKYLRTAGFLDNDIIFHARVCNCQECQKTIDGDITNFSLFGESDSKLVKRGTGFVTMDFPTRDTKVRCLKHYLESKKWEYEFADKATKEDLITDLKKGIEEYEKAAGINFVSYLETWEDVLNKGV